MATTSKTYLALALIGVLALGADAQAQTVNGGFENWGALTGTGVPPAGTPTGWSVTTASVGVTQIAGLTAGSTYAALVVPGTSATSSGSLTQVYSTTATQLTSYKLSFDLEVSSAAATNRLAQLYLSQASNVGNPLINMAIISTGANTASVNFYNGSAWVSVGTGITTAGGFNTSTNAFSNPSVYSFSLTVNNFTSSGVSYDLSYGVAGGTMTTYANLSYTWGTPNATGGLSSASFIGPWGGSTPLTPYAVDNYVYEAIPEPTAMALMAGGLLLLCGRQMRRKY